MKNVKLYNVIFPLWLILFFPPVLFIALAGNFIIDSLVVVACYYVYKVKNTQIKLINFYKKSILKVWIFGFVADAFGAILLLISVWNDNIFPYKITSAINYNAFRHPVALIIVIFAMLLASTFIFFFNYRIIFYKVIENKVLRFRIAITIAIITIPWTFIIPTSCFTRY